MNRREFLFGSVACAMMPRFGKNSNNEFSSRIKPNCYTAMHEIIECRRDIVYFAEKYIKLPYGKQLILKDWQKKYLRHLAAGKEAVLDAYRQSGKTLMNSIYAIWKANFTPGQKITLVTVKGRMADSWFENIKMLYGSLPEWMRSGEDKMREYYIRDKTHIVMLNQSEIVVTYASADFCGYFPGNIVIFDELAFFSDEQFRNIVETVCPVVGSCENSQIILASTPSASDDMFSGYVNYLKSGDCKHEDREMLFEVKADA